VTRIKVAVEAGPRTCEILVGSGVSSRLPALMAKTLRRGKAVLVADARLRAKAGKLQAALRRTGWDARLLRLTAGEAAKSPRSLQAIYDFLIRSGADRRTPLVALGGGTIGDAAGFAAATYFRGIPLVHVPTTLLAQVDSAIGGKTAINHPKAKNAIGAFHQPALVVEDVDFLKTLPKREFEAGMAEVVKYGLVFDPAFARWLDVHWPELMDRRPGLLVEMIARSVRWKTKVVAADERDLSGRRELLNFGHTVGHALETASGYRLLHGEAVAWGMRAAVELSQGRGWLRKGAALAGALLARLPAPAWPAGLAPERLLEPMRLDKKARAGRGVFILLRELGRPVRVDDVGREELLRALSRIR